MWLQDTFLLCTWSLPSCVYPESYLFVGVYGFGYLFYLWCIFYFFKKLWGQNVHSLTLNVHTELHVKDGNESLAVCHVPLTESCGGKSNLSYCFPWVCSSWPPLNPLCLRWEGKLSVSWETEHMNRFFHFHSLAVTFSDPDTFHLKP